MEIYNVECTRLDVQGTRKKTTRLQFATKLHCNCHQFINLQAQHALTTCCGSFVELISRDILVKFCTLPSHKRVQTCINNRLAIA